MTTFATQPSIDDFSVRIESSSYGPVTYLQHKGVKIAAIRNRDGHHIFSGEISYIAASPAFKPLRLLMQALIKKLEKQGMSVDSTCPAFHFAASRDGSILGMLYLLESLGFVHEAVKAMYVKHRDGVYHGVLVFGDSILDAQQGVMYSHMKRPLNGVLIFPAMGTDYTAGWAAFQQQVKMQFAKHSSGRVLGGFFYEGPYGSNISLVDVLAFLELGKNLRD